MSAVRIGYNIAISCTRMVVGFASGEQEKEYEMTRLRRLYGPGLEAQPVCIETSEKEEENPIVGFSLD